MKLDRVLAAPLPVVTAVPAAILPVVTAVLAATPQLSLLYRGWRVARAGSVLSRVCREAL